MKGREDLEGNSGDRVVRIVGRYVSGCRRGANFRTFWISYIGLKQCFVGYVNYMAASIYARYYLRDCKLSASSYGCYQCPCYRRDLRTANRMNYESKVKLVMNRLEIGDMYCKLPILLDEYHDVLDVAEGIFFSSSNCNSAGKDKKGVSKGSHLRSCSQRASLKCFLRK